MRRRRSRRRRVTTSMINGFVAVDSREFPNVSSPRYGFILSPVRSFGTATIVPVTKQNYGPVYTYRTEHVIKRARDIELSLVAPRIRVTATGWDFQPTFSRILGDVARVFWHSTCSPACLLSVLDPLNACLALNATI